MLGSMQLAPYEIPNAQTTIIIDVNLVQTLHKGTKA